MLNEFETFDYLAEAQDRVTELLKDKQVFDKYLQLMIEEETNLQEVFRSLMQERSIDTAVGAQLDIIGEIVGQPRELIDTALIKYFAFVGVLDAQSYGDLDNTSLGGYFRGIDDPLSGNTLLNDSQYRMFIKAKIVKNNTQVTPNQVLQYLSFVFGADINRITAEGTAEFTLLIGKELNSFERALLTYKSTYNGYESSFVPKPIGVRVNYGEFDTDNYFGYLGSPNAKGYGDLSDPLVGGKYAKLY
jgi:hypothetical protein